MRRPNGYRARWLLHLLPRDWRDSVEGDLEEERGRRRRVGRPAGAVWTTVATAHVAARLWLGRVRGPRLEAVRPGTLVDGLRLDVGLAVRGLLTNRGYALVTVLTLALGIGANTAVFTMANWLLLRPVPGIVNQHELVTIGFGADGARGPISVADLRAVADATPALDGLAGYEGVAIHVGVPGGSPQRLDAALVTASYFDVLAGAVARGRGFTSDEGRDPGRSPVAVISHRFWQSALGGSPDAVGREVVVNGVPFLVIGVTDAGFHGTSRSGSTDVWIPVAQHRLAVPALPGNAITDRRVRLLFGMVGRLAPHATLDEVQAQIEAAREGIADAFPEDRLFQRWQLVATAGLEWRPWVLERLGYAMTLLMGIVGLLLVLTTANVANLMLARTAGRRAELATRLALGATRTRVARLVLAESAVLSMLAGAVALAAAIGIGALLEGTPVLAGLPPMEQARVDWRVFAFATVVSSSVALLAGLLPAVASSRVDAVTVLRDAGRSQTVARRRARMLLTTVQIAVSVTLLVGAGLLARSMMARLSVDTGFDPSRVLTFSVEPGLQRDGPPTEAFFRDLLARVQESPGVRSAGLAWLRPFSQGAADMGVWLEGAGETAAVSGQYNAVSPGFFEALSLDFVEGRDFTEAELQRPAAAGDPVVILTASLARQLFGSAPAVGRRLEGRFSGGTPRTIVGVVEDVRLRRLASDREDSIFEPFGQSFPLGWATVVIGLDAPAADVASLMRETVASLDATLPIYDVIRLDAAIRQTVADDLLVMRLTLTFAVLATLLAAIGLYGVMSRTVAERRREIGIRTALGARPGAVARLVSLEAALILLLGVGLGVPLSWWLSWFIQNRLFGVERLDLISVAAALVVVTVATFGSALPAARRAARTDPANVLRLA